ncbi:peroxisome targeting signal 1 receptor, putative [Leishmania tarentolae]|uniref:Peroxisome targeting signal 1 receptor, putative n=1 Tax=Leishmania tarentolae TaxID=5689 RepID=A0A640KSQ0_LEITA|nr:peroxisome targeting signal 1 receptor, putative [Leishmania tarentolae]
MDCNTGMQLGQQFSKDAMMMHGGVPMNGAMSEQDALLMSTQVTGGNPMMAAQWAQNFQQQQVMQAMQQQHEMEQVFQSSQQQQAAVAQSGQMMGMTGPQQQQFMVQQQQVSMMNAAMMSQGMMAANMGFGMMMPRTQYQPSSNLSALLPKEQQQQPLANLAPAAQDSAWADQLSQQQWSTDYSQAQTFSAPGMEDKTVEERIKDSEFYKFMDQIKSKEVLIDEEKGELVQGPGPEVGVPEDVEHLRQWAEMEGLGIPESAFQPPPPASAMSSPKNVDPDAYVKEMDMADNDVEDWAQEYAEMQDRLQKMTNSTDYPFEPSNPYMFHDFPFDEGMEMLQLGNLAEAALAFEAVCQKDNSNEKAWQILGTTQAENEKDGLAIIALNNARKLNPCNLEVHAALAVSHTNERNADAAMDSLKAWLVNHPEYEQLASVSIPPNAELDVQETFFFADPSRTREVRTLYEAAIEMNPSDSQLFTNLGVLHNVAHEFDEAAECFRKAVALHADDPKMWNKLGATLANGGHPEQALEAYNRALDINPGYVRAMYNMAVAYSNMSQYNTAARQVVKAIASQQGGTKPSGEGSIIATRNMWDLLRMTLNLMDRDDLVQLTYNEQLEPFVKEFGLEGHV